MRINMRNRLLQVTLSLGLLTGLGWVGCTSGESAQSPFEYVDPFIGTGGHGHTYPGATVPFGMMQLSPDTRLDGWDGCGGYHYSDSVIYGFSHTHLSGTGVSDYGDILLMPTIGTPRTNNGADGKPGYSSRFQHTSEVAEPGYYAVHLDDYDIDAEFSVTERAGFHRYKFNNADTCNLILDLQHRDRVMFYEQTFTSETEITGVRRSSAWAVDQQVYFVIQFSEPAISQEWIGDTALVNGQKKPPIGVIRFIAPDNKEILVRIGISAVDIEGARRNLETEIPAWEFDKVRNEAAERWNRELSRVTVKGGTDAEKTIFYTGLYHSFIAPNLFSDMDGRYRGMDGEVHQADATKVYTVFSLWDTFRGTHPLFTILQRERTLDFIKTFLKHYEQGGRLPVWELAGNETDCMIGYHSVSVIADAYQKGIQDFDTQLAFEAMEHSANTDLFGLPAYRTQCFIPSDQEAESVSKTLEYAYDDWCIAEFARANGWQEDANNYYSRSHAYRNLFDPGSGFLRARTNGNWWQPFDPAEVNFNYTEANAWQYSMFAPHDINGLIDLMGGPDQFEAHLDALFSADSETTGREQADITGLIGQYAHGNEPSHHMAYLYNFIGKPWKTQEMVRRIRDEHYQAAPDGLSGNEDCGQMSSWYVLSAMGFYPVTPGTNKYVIGTPLFDEVNLSLENGNSFKITARFLSEENTYIQSASLNGTPLTRSYLTQEEILAGGELVFLMGAEDQAEWATAEADRPSQQIPDLTYKEAPVFEYESRTFTDSLVVTINAINPENTPSVFVWEKGNISEGKSYPVGSKLVLRESKTLIAGIGNQKVIISPEVSADFFKIKGGQSIEVKTEFASQYAAGGEKALIDQLRGQMDFRTGQWQGYRGDLEAVVDLGSQTRVKSVGISCLQDIKSWIFMPRSVQMSISTDGKNWKDLPLITSDIPDNQYGPIQNDFMVKVPANQSKTRFIRVKAVNYGICPEWHIGAGGQGWIFADEILIQ